MAAWRLGAGRARCASRGGWEPRTSGAPRGGAGGARGRRAASRPTRRADRQHRRPRPATAPCSPRAGRTRAWRRRSAGRAARRRRSSTSAGYALFEPGPRAAVLDFVRARRAAVVGRPGLGRVAARRRLPRPGPRAPRCAWPTRTRPPSSATRSPAPTRRSSSSAAPRAPRSSAASRSGRPAEVVDLTGAGDAFAAGFLAAQQRGGEDRLALAVATAARAVAAPAGARASASRPAVADVGAQR